MPTDDAASDAVVVLDKKFARAVEDACALHRTQMRKGTDVPYAAHLLGVASLVLEGGGTQREAIAALFHDSLEDTSTTPKQIRKRYGRKVARIVVACTDVPVGKSAKRKKPRRGAANWRERKMRSLEHLRDPKASESVLRVRAADALYNARARRSPISGATDPRRGDASTPVPSTSSGTTGRCRSCSPGGFPACSATSCVSPCASWRTWPAGGSTSATRKPVAEQRSGGTHPTGGNRVSAPRHSDARLHRRALRAARKTGAVLGDRDAARGGRLLERGALLGRRRRRPLTGRAVGGTLRERHALIGQTLLLRVGERGRGPPGHPGRRRPGRWSPAGGVGRPHASAAGRKAARCSSVGGAGR